MNSVDLRSRSRGKQRLFYGWVIVGTVFCASVAIWAFYYSLSVFFDTFQHTFNANRAGISLISSIFMFTEYISQPLYGWAVDRYNPRILTAIGGLLVFGGLLLSSYASSLWQLYLASGLMAGLGTGALFTPYVAIISTWFTKRRGLAIGLISAGSGMGLMIGPIVSQSLLAAVGWQTTFVLLGVANLIFFSVAAYAVSRRPSDKDFLPYGVLPSQGKDNPSQELAKIKMKPIASENDVSLAQAVRGKDMWLLLTMRIFLSLTIFMVNLHLVNFATDSGLSLASAALLMTFVGGASIFGKIGAGHLVDMMGSKKMIISCAAAMAAVMFWFSSPKGSQMLQLSSIIYGLAYGGSYALFNTAIADTFGIRDIGKILGIVNVGSAVGSLIGPWLAGFIFDRTGNYSIAFLIGAIAAVISLVLVLPVQSRARQVSKEIH